jgi:two-component system response regulator NreC
MPGKAETTIVLADDHTVIRAGLRALLEAEDDLRVIGEAADSAGAAKLVEDRRPDVLVLDLNMPGAEPRADLPRLRAAAPGTAIVVLTMQSDPRVARDLLRAGAAGFVLKQSADRNLAEAIRAAAAGGSYVDPRLGAELARLAADPLDSLSEREVELLRLVALGHTNREIGERLGLSVRTVETHRSHIQQKLGLTGRPELTRYALEHGLLSSEDVG